MEKRYVSMSLQMQNIYEVKQIQKQRSSGEGHHSETNGFLLLYPVRQ